MAWLAALLLERKTGSKSASQYETIMIESPLIKEIVAEATQEAILEVLRARFDSVPEDVAKRVRAVRGEKKLKGLIKHAARCPDLQAFRQRLLS